MHGDALDLCELSGADMFRESIVQQFAVIGFRHVCHETGSDTILTIVDAIGLVHHERACEAAHHRIRRYIERVDLLLRQVDVHSYRGGHRNSEPVSRLFPMVIVIDLRISRRSYHKEKRRCD